MAMAHGFDGSDRRARNVAVSHDGTRQTDVERPHGGVLIVDDSLDTLEMLEKALRGRGYVVGTATSADEALAYVAAHDVEAVVTDLRLEGRNGIELCEQLAESRPDVPVVVMTGFGTLDAAVAALRAGAHDFIMKPLSLETLYVALGRAVQHRALHEEVKRLRRTVASTTQFGETVGESPEMVRLQDLIDRVARVDASAVITGETGTGKELVARMLHARSGRAHGPFVAVNCAALPAPLLESELFGHERGAFTDAKTRHTGLFVQASKGTMFLDEVGSLPLELQPKLLRALEQRVVRPVGSNVEVPFDARVVSATNQDLEGEVEAGRFRDDLFFRINVINIPLPPLRARGNDVLLLAQHFVLRYAQRLAKHVVGVSSGAAEKLLAYAWPGNVRELQNCIERAISLTRYETLTVEDLPEKVQSYKPRHVFVDLDHPEALVSVAENERRHVLHVLEATRGNKADAARILGFDRRTLYRKLDRFRGQSGA